jgi:asparaginyl-tRNA synthetase
MRPNNIREDGKQTVQNCDLICQYEIVGGSMRDNSYESLMDEITKRKIDSKPLEWYTDLRKKGCSETGGFGLGFNRLVSLCTGIPNIKDITPFYVAYEQLM